MPTHFIIDFFSTFSPVLISTVLAILLTTVFYVEKNRGLPPGPIGLPYFGYWPFMKDSNVHLQLDRLKKKYGDVFCFGCTGRLYINLGSYKAIREALVTKSECFGERMSGYHLSGHAFKGAILYTNGEAWRVNRKYLLGVIKVRGANSFKTSIAGPLYDSIQSSVNELKGRNGEPLNLIEYCSHRCNTFLRLTMFGNIGVTAEQIMTFNKFNSVLTQCLTPVNMLLCGTFAKYFIFPLMPHYKETVKCIKQMEKIVFDIINEHKETYDSENPRNIIDEYFIERDRRLSKGDPTAKYFTEGILMGNLSQFMGDGVLIASLFTCQLMKKFILHPEEQDKLYKEIVEVVGLDRLPTIEDKSKLTYFNAYMLESRREAEFFPFFPSQECVKETTLNGFKIPKGAIVIQNFYSCHHDPKVYDEPEKFNPLRYIQAEGKKRPDNPIFFGLDSNFSFLNTPTHFIVDFFKTFYPISIPLSLTVVIATVMYIVKDRGLPPGPIGLPYFGYWLFMKNSNAHFKLNRLKKKYGDVFCFGCTGRLYINLGSYKAIRESLVTKSECFGERMSGYHLLGHVFKDGVLYINGEAWRTARKFFLVVIKERGANSFKTSIAGPLYDSIQSSVNELKARNGKPLNLIEFCTHRCNTFLQFTMFGNVGATPEQIVKFNALYSVVVQCITPMNMLLCGTFAKYFIFPFTPYYNEMVKCNKQMDKIAYDIINKHKETYNPENPRNIIDEYFKERDRRLSKGDPTAKYFTDEILMGTLSQFMGDGVLIVSSFTCLLMKNFLLYPEEQDKLYKEIVEVVGLQRLPTIEDKSKLTYFNAYVLKSIRTSEFFTFFPSQECIQETTLSGYKIPKGAVVIENFYSCHHDPKVYDEPEKFNPSRYIQKEGKRKPDQPILFGMGKRSCVGESYVMIQSFLMLVTLIQNFHLSLAEGANVSVESFLTSNLQICAKPRMQ